jgi:hypothetical protein
VSRVSWCLALSVVILAATACDGSKSVARPAAATPHLFLLEEEYRRAVLAAEVAWLHGVIEDLAEDG